MTIYLLAFDLFMIIYAIHMQSQVANLQYQIDELKKLNEQDGKCLLELKTIQNFVKA